MTPVLGMEMGRTVVLKVHCYESNGVSFPISAVDEPSSLRDLLDPLVCAPGVPGCLKVMIRKGGELFNQSPNPARRRRRVAKGKGNWSLTTARSPVSDSGRIEGRREVFRGSAGSKNRHTRIKSLGRMWSKKRRMNGFRWSVVFLPSGATRQS